MHRGILITSAGRRVDLVESFKEQTGIIKPSALVHAIDSIPSLSSACQVADRYAVSPKVNSPNYIEYMLDYCSQQNITVLIPTIDTELLSLSENTEKFKSIGTSIVVSSKKFIQLCSDKRLTEHVFHDHNVDYPEIYHNRRNIKFPCFAKPYSGSSSIGACSFHSINDVSHSLLNDNSIMFMELVDQSYSEYTIDAYYSKDGVLKCLVPRLRIEVRGGEVSKGVTRKGTLYEFIKSNFAKVEGARGCITIQCFFNHDTNHCVGLEINPRFGGGYPLSYSAGANFPGFIIREYILGDEISFNDEWKENLLMLRYDSKVLIENYV